MTSSSNAATSLRDPAAHTGAELRHRPRLITHHARHESHSEMRSYDVFSYIDEDVFSVDCRDKREGTEEDKNTPRLVITDLLPVDG